MKKKIFFDFGRTLVQHPEDGVGLEIVMEAGAENEEDAKAVRDEVFSAAKFANEIDEGLLSFDEYLKKIRNAVPERLRDCAERAVMYNIDRLPLIDGMEDLLKKLKKDGFKLYITSNMDLRHAKQMREHKIAKYFDGMIFSSEIKTRKPYPEFFETALKTFEAERDECIFVDDLEENVVCAQKCGITGFVFKGNAEDAEKFIYENAL